MLWTCSSPLRFHQIIEDSNCLFSENRHFDQNLPGRYTLNRKDSRECSDALGYSDPPTELAFMLNLKKSVMTPSPEMEFLGMVIND